MSTERKHVYPVLIASYRLYVNNPAIRLTLTLTLIQNTGTYIDSVVYKNRSKMLHFLIPQICNRLTTNIRYSYTHSKRKH